MGDPNYGATGVRFPTHGKVWAIDLADGTPKIIDCAALGLAGRWITIRQTGNENGVAYFFRATGSTAVPNLETRDTFKADGTLQGDKSDAGELLADGAESEPGFVDPDFPILVLVSTGSAAVLRLKDAQVL